MAKTRKAQVMFTCTYKVRDVLARRAERENRTLSNLVEAIVLAAIASELANQEDDEAKVEVE